MSVLLQKCNNKIHEKRDFCLFLLLFIYVLARLLFCFQFFLFFCVMIVEVQKPDWCDKNRKKPANHHQKFENQHRECIYDKHIVSENKIRNAMIYESRIWIENL